MNAETFSHTLANCLNPNDVQRNHSVAQVEQYKKENPIEFTKILVQILGSSPNIYARSISAVLLRRVLSMNADSLLKFLSEDLVSKLQTELLDILRKEEVKDIRNKLVYTLAAFLCTPLRQGKAPNLIPMLCDWTRDESPAIRESSFFLINQLSNFILDHGLQPYLKVLYNTLQLGMQENQTKEVQVAALQATTNLVRSLKKKNQQLLVPLTENMLNVLARLLNMKAEAEAISVIESFIEIVVSKPRFFQKTKNVVVMAMLQIVKTKTFADDMLRHTAMEWITSIVESMPSTITFMPNFAQEVIPVCMTLITEVDEDDKYWSSNFEDDDDLTNYDVGIETLDRICRAADNSRDISRILFTYYSNYASHENWKFRFACAMSVAQAVEGCLLEFKEQLPQIVSMILTYANDNSPRVRYAALHSIAQIATELNPFFQENYHETIVPVLIKCLNDPIMKIRAHAATSIVNFTSDVEKEIIEPYVDSLLSNLHGLLQTNIKYVQEQTLIAICALVDCTSQLFLKYYDYFVPLLIQILTGATGVQDRILRARAIECISLIAVAVGKNAFKDLELVTKLFLQIQNEAAEDDPAHIYLVQSWARLARCLRDDFVPLLPHAMEEILRKASLEPQIKIVDGGEAKDEFEKDCRTSSFTIQGVGVKRVSVKTSDLEEKSLACTQILNFLDLLDVKMFDYVERITQIIIPLLESSMIDEIRMTAAEIAPKLVSIVKKQCDAGLAKPEMVTALIQFILDNTVATLNLSEVDQSTETIVLDCVQECLKLVKNVLSQQQIETFSTLLLAILNRSLIMKKKYSDEAINEEEESLELLQRLEEKIMAEENLQSTIGDVVGALLQSHHSLFFEIFTKQFFKIFQGFIHQDASDEDFGTGLCVLCDYVEFGGESAIQKFDIYSSLFFSCINHPAANVKHACVYGIGCMAIHSGSKFDPLVPQALKTLQGILSLRNTKKAKKYEPVITNAVSTLFKIIKFRSHHAAVNVNEMLAAWSKLLPVGGDWVEAQNIHGEFLNLVESRHISIIGENFSNINHILNVISRVINSYGLKPEQNELARNVLIGLQKDLPPQMLEAAWKSLPEKQQRKLNNFMAETST